MLFFKSILIQRGNKYYFTWQLIFTLAALFAAFDSCLVLFKPVQTAFSGLGLPTDWATGITLVLILVYLVVIDYAFSVFYPNSINEIIENVKNKADNLQWAIALLTFVFCLFQVCTTVGISFYLRHTSAAMAIAAPTLTRVDSVVAVRTANDLKAVGSLEESIGALKRKRESAIANSQRNKELQKLQDKGNGWAIAKLKDLAKDAAVPFDKDIKSNIGAKTALLTQNAKNVEIVSVSTANDNKFLKDKYTEQTNAIADFLMWFSIAATGFQCIAGLMMALYRSKYNKKDFTRMTTETPVKTVVSEETEKAVSPTEKPEETVETTERPVEQVLVPKVEIEEIEMFGQKGVFEKPVERTSEEANEAELDKQWVKKLETIELDGETYTPSDIIQAKSNIVVYHKRSLTSAKEETRTINRLKTDKFKRVLELTGLTVKLYEDGTGKVFI